jgi:UDP-2,4-diacetamido-2,4,6-trideoxy-beta-L-altropyranose hydrolase
VVFCVAAGPRVGFGHLLRSRTLARALGVAHLVIVRGAESAREAARSMGAVTLPARLDTLTHCEPALVVVDDPLAAAGSRWVSAARQLGVPVASVHDLGVHYLASDLVIDGSMGVPVRATPRRLTGPQFALVHPWLVARRPRGLAHRTGGLLIALGGGDHVRHLGVALARALVGSAPVRLAAGFSFVPRPALPEGAHWIHPSELPAALSDCALAVVSGGMTMYEACALAAPAVAVSLTPGQRQTIRACARRGGVVDAGPAGRPDAVGRVVDAVTTLLAEPTARQRLATQAGALVDGRGAWRVASRLVGLVAAVEEARHAA